MTEQLTLPGLAPPRWWDYVLAFFFAEFIGQPTHFSRARVMDKRYRKEETFRVNAGYGGSMPTTIKAAWLIEVRTSHGDVEVEVSEQFYDLTRRGDSLRVSYQLSRLYTEQGGLKAKLLT